MFKKLGISVLFSLMVVTAGQADDIDVYTAQIAAMNKPNILFVLDYSGSMGWSVDRSPVTPANPSRLDILKSAMQVVLNENRDRINAGLGSLYSSDVTGIQRPIGDLSAPGAAAAIESRINSRGAGGATATVDALVEAAEYFKGSQSPIRQTCQANAIVLITDGQPTRIRDNAALRRIVGNTGINGCEDLSSRIFGRPPGGNRNGNCGPEVLRNLSQNNQNPSIPDSNVRTYTVGFNIDGPGKRYLEYLAEAGQGDFFDARQPGELTDAISEIVDDIVGGSESFATPAIDVNNGTFSHDNKTYHSLFSPSTRSAWSGNLKGYFIDDTGLLDINGALATTVDEQGTRFRDDAQSFWSDSPDGNKVSEGGASAKLQRGNRKLYTFTGDSIPGSGVMINTGHNRLRSSNNAITPAMLGVSSEVERDEVLDWIQNAPMGDPLHSKSVSIFYRNKKVVYVMTNQGLIHAIDATRPIDYAMPDARGGDELFAFMPKRLLANLPLLKRNRTGFDHIYGLDGSITPWHEDTNGDGIVNNGETVLLILGMRRGGTAYYALDVSSPNTPRLMWMIDNSMPAFNRLAESWSRMSLVTVADGGTTRKVLMFGGGYDSAVQDSVNAPTPSSGNAIYMVDSAGQLRWKVDQSNHADMRYSIPSDLTIIDSDGDKIADRLYVGDVGGQLWRVDFENIRATPSVTLLADLHDGNHQPFFYPPSVAFNRDSNGNFLSITIGSGNRTNPLLTGSRNNFYMVRDKSLEKGAPSGLSTVRINQLYDATDNQLESTNPTLAANAQSALENAKGWRIRLAENEKALSGLVTFEGKLLATTFQQETVPDPSFCGFQTLGRYYQLSVEDATPIGGFGGSTSAPGTQNRAMELSSTGIPSSPLVVFPEGGSSVNIVVDKQVVNTLSSTLNIVYWHSK